MVNATALGKSLFIMPTENANVLFRIEFLVVVSTLLFLVMFILDIFRGYFHSAIIKAILSIVDNVSNSIVIYVMGAMQTAPFKNELFPVWAIVLVGFRHSIDFISGYGIPDQDGRRFVEWRNVVKLLGVAFLNKTRGSKFAYPLWSLWGLQIVRSCYTLLAHNLAFNSVWHGKSSELVSEYMRRDNFKLKDCKPDSMEGYKYLVYGETKLNIILEKPRYVLHINTNPRETQSLITLDKIWQCDGALLQPHSTQADNIKDLSLAFSLSRLLRCRLEDVALHKDSFPITKNLVELRIIQEEASRAFGVKGANRAFGVMELEMAFLKDYFNTRYPMVFWHGFPSLYFSFCLSVATFAVACWLSVDIRRVYKTPKDEVAHVIHGVNIDMIITWLFMFFMIFKEIWEMVSYLLSDWTRLLLACTYVRWVCRCVRNGCMEKFISSFFTSEIANRRWHGVIDQYVFLQSYDHSPSVWNLMHTISTGAIPKADEGAKLNKPINIPECVKSAILMTLRSLLDLKRAHPLDDIPLHYRWACFELPTSSHIILVWHIATSLCEIRFAQDRDINLSNTGFPLSALLYLTSFCRRRRPPQPFLVNEKKILDDVLKTRYTVANSLSRYCAYLLVSKPDLVPDSFLVPKKIFEETVKEARDILKGSDSLEKRYNTLIEEADKAAQDTGNSKNRNVVQQGAKLAKELIDQESEESRWEILAEVWAYLLVHIAPSWKAAAHKKCLESGGEFITHIWALLWHCGIEQSMLWPVDGGHGNVVRGMRNLGNTCYFNAVLQSILALDKLRMRMLGIDAPTGSLAQELKKLFMETSEDNGAGGTLVPENLFSIMCSRNAGLCGVMEDSNNVLSSLLDGLNNEKPTMVESLFRGQIDKHVSSKECEHTSVTTQVLDLSLAIPSKKPVSIEDCLDLYAIGEVDDWDCTACSAAAGNASSNQKDTTVDDDQTEQSDSATHPKEQSSHPAEEQTRTPNQDKGKLPMLDGDAHQMEQSHNKHKEEEKIYRAAKVHFRIRKAPPVLTIQLKRFDYVHHDRSDELEEHVSFQEILDITKFMDPRCVENEDYKYCLVAVIVHDGPILFEGHNFAYVRASGIGGQQQANSVTRSWFRASDENVTKVSLEEVLKCQAYILFYERVEKQKGFGFLRS